MSWLARLRADVLFALVDIALISLAYLAVLALRFDGSVPPRYWQPFQWFLPMAVGVHLLAHWLFRLYGQLWRHASVQEARRLLLAGTVSTGVLLAVIMADRRLPISVVAFGGAAATMLVGINRFRSRLFAFNRQSPDGAGLRVVVVGAGNVAAALVRDMLAHPTAGLVPVAVVDDDAHTWGRSLLGVRVVGGVDGLASVIESFNANQALLAVPEAGQDLVRRVAAQAEIADVPLKVVPAVTDLIAGRVSIRDVRDVRIEDLLGRQQVETDRDTVAALLAGRRVLITGAGGSIGAEIARQVAGFGPEALLLLDHDETHLHDALMTLPPWAEPVLADVRDRRVLCRVFEQHRPEVVFHAAAHKHVPMLEKHPSEAAATNVFGTANVVAAADRAGTERLVLISTDKAVRPSSVMGASKRVAEHVVLHHARPGTRYCAVRFGNVLGSRGSVIPTFVRQIEEGGPVTVTDARMTRFFMTIGEAVQLVLQAAALADGGEVFMLDMGEPVRIMDLAERMVRLSGRRAGIDVEIRITGVRPGEKFAEELRSPGEEAAPTAHPAILRISSGVPAGIDFVRSLEELAVAVSERDDARVKEYLFRLANEEAVIDLRDAVAAELLHARTEA